MATNRDPDTRYEVWWIDREKVRHENFFASIVAAQSTARKMRLILLDGDVGIWDTRNEEGIGF